MAALSGNGPAHDILGTYFIFHQPKIRRACVYAQSRQSLYFWCTQIISVDNGSGQTCGIKHTC